MSTALLAAAILATASLLLYYSRRPAGFLELPFLYACVYAAWVLPQAFRVIESSDSRGIDPTPLLCLVTLSLLALAFGYTRPHGASANPSGYDLDRAAVLALVMTVFGGFFYWRLTQLPTHLLSVNQRWSGAPVVYLFFASPLYYGFILSANIYFRNHSKVALAALLIATPVLCERVALAGRRGVAVEILVGTLATFWFTRRTSINGKWALAAIPLCVVAINGAHLYRTAAYRGGHSIASGFENALQRAADGAEAVVSNADQLVVPQHCSELMNAAMTIESADRQGRFDLGTHTWNAFVRRFVPRQLFGSRFKHGLLVPLPSDIDPRLGYTPPIGTTSTGFADSYLEFSYLGVALFFVIGYVFRGLWVSACGGNLASQVLYACLVRDAIQAVTHSASWLVMAGIETAIFLGPAFWFCRLRPTHRNPA